MAKNAYLLNVRKILIAFLFISAILYLTGCQILPENKKSETIYESGTITITGDGVGKTINLTLDELKEMDSKVVSYTYSCVNNWPIKKFFVARGIPINHLLQLADIKDTAQTIMVKAADGYSAFFVREQLEEIRYYYPKLLEGYKDGYEEVPALLSWEYSEGTNNEHQIVSGKIGLFLGQKGLNDVNTVAFVKDVVVIEVLTTPSSQWAEVQAEPASGKVELGTEVFLHHPEQDFTKIYYTLDGTNPDENSLVYNISTSYYQPDLIKPIIIDESITIKTIAIGLGKTNSEISTFEYVVE